ncbi:MAG: hypothetical protein JO053_04590 [Acidobacteria bacterium]|nr:hypothetical protein [Acidobacteriota bacterium]
MNKEELLDTWAINDRINGYLLASIEEGALNDQLASKGRNVAKQFAHIHNVRLMWLKVAAPDLLGSVTKIDDGPVDKALLATSLAASGEAIAELLSRSAETGKVKGFKPHITGFLGYMLVHDAHHRSQIILALKQSGHPVDKKVAYGIWEWGRR